MENIRKIIIKLLNEQVKIAAKELGITKDEVLKRSSFTKPINNYSNEDLQDATRRIRKSLEFTRKTIKRR